MMNPFFYFYMATFHNFMFKRVQHSLLMGDLQIHSVISPQSVSQIEAGLAPDLGVSWD